jgi:hypothetical protein
VYYPEKLSSEFTKYINFIIQILFFYYDPDFNKLTFSTANKNLSNMLKLVDTNVSSSGIIKRSDAFSHKNIKDVFGEDVNFKVMFEKVWEKVTTDTGLMGIITPGGIYVPNFVQNDVDAQLRLSKSTTVNGNGDQFLFIKAAVINPANTLLLGAYELFKNEIYSLERVYFWDVQNPSTNPDEYNILTFDEEINNTTADGKFYLQDSKKGRRALTEVEVKDLKIRYAYYFYVKEDDDVKNNSQLKIGAAEFNGLTEAANANDLYTKSIEMNKLSKIAEVSKTLLARVQQAANSPMNLRSIGNRLLTWVYSWKSQQ